MSQTFPLETLEQAAQNLVMQQNPESSLAVLHGWENDQDCIILSCVVLEQSSNLYAKYYASVILDQRIPVKWESISSDDRNKIRGFIITKLQENSDNQQIVCALSRTIAHIAIFDFPEEWPDFENLLVPQQENYATFQILEAFLTDVEESKFITKHRRQKLRNHLNRRIDIISQRISNGFLTEQIADQALNAYANMLIWANNFIVTRDLLNIITHSFLPKESTITTAVLCLKRIFIKRYDSEILFQQLYIDLFQALVTIKLPTGQSITSVYIVVKFICSIFANYMMMLERNIAKTANKELKQNILDLITILLSMREDIPNKFWILWSEIFRRIVSQNIEEIRFTFTKDLFDPMIPIIRKNLYEILPFSVDDDGTLQPQVQSCIGGLIEADYSGFLNFLEHQSLSSSLCYALGCLMSVRVPTQDMISFTQIVQQLIDESDNKLNENDGSDYLVPLLFGLSRTAFFLHAMDLFDKFFDLVINCLEMPIERLRNAATHALLYTAEKHSNLFSNENETDSIKISLLVQMSESFVINFPVDSAVRMFLCVTILLIQNRKNLFASLFEPIISSLRSQNGAIIQKALEIVCEISSKQVPKLDNPNPEKCEYIPAGSYFAEFVLPPILELLPKVILDRYSSLHSNELILNALGSLIRCANEYSAVDQIIRNTLDIFTKRGEPIPCFYTFIGKLRNQFSEMNALYGEIMNTFVYPIIPLNNPVVQQNTPLAEILLMINSFKYTLKETNVEWVVMVCMSYGITSLEKETNQAATKTIIRVFREMETNDLRELFSKLGLDLFIIVFEVFSNSILNDTFQNLSKMLFKICRLLSEDLNVPQEVNQLLLAALTRTFDGKNQAVYEEFVQYLTSNIHDFSKFSDAITNFLIMQNKISPGDTSLFRPKKHQSFFHGILPLSFEPLLM